MVVLETMILGKPILCSTGAGASELVKDGHNVYRFAPEDPVTLAQHMQHFIENPEIIPDMGQQSQEIMKAYTPTKSGEFLAQITECVLNDLPSQGY